MLNLNGEVIGINTAVSSEAQGIGFAIPTSTITDVLENLKSNTQIPKKPVPFIGAKLTAITSDIAKKLGIDTTKGSIVSNVVYGTPAYRGDLRQYDVITGMDGTSYNTPDDLIAAIQKKAIGDKVTLNVIRGGNKIDVKVEVGNKNDFEDVE
ncbi:S1C family serine protease [Cohnella faecalis]|uniref:S1C family serine protease n=1 Tax=Cohnella faecalis TaxID=2315694 RepID=UPI001F16C972|nr:PDZ domain-containing protein [Cohnella faecalis]